MERRGPRPQVLTKFDGTSLHDVLRKGRRRYSLTRLPKYLILHMKRFTRNNFFVEKNPTIVTFGVKNLELKDAIPVPAAKGGGPAPSKRVRPGERGGAGAGKGGGWGGGAAAAAGGGPGCSPPRGRSPRRAPSRRPEPAPGGGGAGTTWWRTSATTASQRRGRTAHRFCTGRMACGTMCRT